MVGEIKHSRYDASKPDRCAYYDSIRRNATRPRYFRGTCCADAGLALGFTCRSSDDFIGKLRRYFMLQRMNSLFEETQLIPYTLLSIDITRSDSYLRAATLVAS